MKKPIVIMLTIILIILVAASIGCSKQEPKKKLVSSKPVKDDSVEITKGTEGTTMPEAKYEEPKTEETTPGSTGTTVTAPETKGTARCDQLTGADFTETIGGTWTKEPDCPQHPAMPKGVTVCRCSYSGPRMFVDVETQTYDENSEAERVYNMYCEGNSAASVGDKGCTYQSPSGPKNVYFKDGNYFVKVSCVGDKCSFDPLTEAAKKVQATLE